MTGAAARRTYLDVMRGLAVLVMIEAHVIDSWTRGADRATNAFGYSLILGGFGAPLFLFLAGVSISLSAGSKARRSNDPRAAARAVCRRGLEIFALAFLFRLQEYVLSGSAPTELLTVDILNIMGPAIAATAWLWGIGRTGDGRAAAFGIATVALAFATPPIRAASWLTPLPDFLEAYIRPVPHITSFAIFPWAAFVPAGALVGLVIDRTRTPSQEARANVGFAVAGGALALLAYAASSLPSPFARSSFWTSSPSFFFLRTGVMVLLVALAFVWEMLRSASGRRWRPLQALGRHSLFIYWIHVDLVYGIVSRPLHGRLSLGGAWAAFWLFSALMVLCSAAKDRFDRRIRPGLMSSSKVDRIAQPL